MRWNRSKTDSPLHLVPDDALWDSFVLACPNSTIFHSSPWLRVLEDVFAVRAVRLGLWQSGTIVAGVPLLVRNLGPFRVAGSPLSNIATPQMGPLFNDECHVSTFLAGLDAYQRTAGLDFYEFTASMTLDAELLEQFGYHTSMYRTLLIDLDDRTASDVWSSFHGRCRTAIRKAERLGVEIEFAKEPSFLDDYWAMTESLYAKQGRRSPIPRHYLEAVWNTFSHSGKLQVLIAHHEGKRVAGAMFLTDGRTMYYLNGASFPHLNHLCANNLIQWRILQWAVETTIPLYDMVGAGMLQIARFKESFGAVPAFLPTARRTTSLLATASLQGYLRFAPTIRHLLFRVQREHVPHQLSPEGMSDPASDRVPAR